MNRNKEKNYLKVIGCINMIENKNKRMWAVFTPTESYYIDDGVKIPADIFEAQYPLTLYKSAVSKGNALDGRTNWIE